MGRVTAIEYQGRYDQLLNWWTQNKRVFRVITPIEQWALHSYYNFAKTSPPRDFALAPSPGE